MTDFGEEDTPEPTPPATPPAADADLAKVKEENAQLRATLRDLNAQALAAKFGLPDAVTSLLSTIPRDQQEAKAQELAEALKPQAGTEPPKEETPAEEPENAEALKGMGDPPTPPDATVKGSEAEWEAKVKATSSIEELMQLQSDAIRSQRGAG
jgi:hypothetical protein